MDVEGDMLIKLVGIVMDDTAQNLIGQGNEIKAARPKKEDIVQE